MGVAAFLAALVLHMHGMHVQEQRAALQVPVWPAQGTITSPYGRDGARWHPGVDIGTLRSLQVRAAVPGRVLLVGQQRGYEGYGNVVVIRSHGLTELYGHLAAFRVHQGQRVWAGERIATAGCTGWCSGTHLHFEVRRRNRAVSPFATVLRPLLHPAAPRVLNAPTRLLASAAQKPQL
jgi:murein DD-endopeptidase MepM/ murein hydrolase activator NlpD